MKQMLQYLKAYKKESIIAPLFKFNQAMNEAIWEGSGHQLKIEAPFVNVSKAEVVRTGLELGVPYALTWSCYEGGEKPCGKCGTCIDRAAAFQANHMEDPALR